MILSNMSGIIFRASTSLGDIAPAGTFTSVGQLVGNALDVLLPLLLILLVGLIIYGGYTYMMSLGDPGKVKGAQAILTNAIIGFLIVAFSFVIRGLINNVIVGI